MNLPTIHRKTGLECSEQVNAFYKQCGSSNQARPSDLFFLMLREDHILGCVRYCVEEGEAMLRSMMVDEKYRRQKIGNQILHAFEAYLQENDIESVYCLPYPHLEKFYGQIDFQTVEGNDIPLFLRDRMVFYEKNSGKKYICMRRFK